MRADGVSPEMRAKLDEEARKLKAEIAEMRAKPDTPAQPLPPRPANLQEAFDSYMLTKKGIAPSTKKSYTESFELFAKMVGGKQRMVHEVEESEFMEFVEALAHVPLHANKRGPLNWKRLLPSLQTQSEPIFWGLWTSLSGLGAV